jgi:hypothetical protein
MKAGSTAPEVILFSIFRSNILIRSYIGEWRNCGVANCDPKPKYFLSIFSLNRHN